MSSLTAFPDYCIYCDQLIPSHPITTETTTTTNAIATATISTISYNQNQKILYCSDQCTLKDQMRKTCQEVKDFEKSYNYNYAYDSVNKIESDQQQQQEQNQMLSPISYTYNALDSISDLQDDFFQLDQEQNTGTNIFPAAQPNMDFSAASSFQTYSPTDQCSPKYVSLFEQISNETLRYHNIASATTTTNNNNNNGNSHQSLNDEVCENNYKIWLNENHI